MADINDEQHSRLGFVEDVPLLPGWPGYRTRTGRSGLDYIDTQLEMAHMAGIFLRQLFTGSWLHSKTGPHPFITFVAGVGLLFAFPGNAEACPAIISVLLIALVAAVQARKKPAPLDIDMSMEPDIKDEDDS